MLDFRSSRRPIQQLESWRRRLWDSGVANTGVEIYLPIGSQSVLGFLCTSIEEYFRKARKLFPAASAPAAVEEMLNGISAGEPIRAEPVNVMFFNSLQVAQSERYLFAEH